ncbi:CYTH domain-containing protein [Aneurinibacillus sp. BA2021]|nr:CYTH domain-containing protein [Aneurinibacillus sp. BA2021]
MSKKEQELKLLLTKETYERLLLHADDTKPVLCQTNYYFDRPDFYMGKSGVMLRVREENGTWILCAKMKLASSSSAVSSIELEQEITPETFEAGRSNPEILVHLLPDEGQKAIRQLLPPSDLIVRGTLRNERRTLYLPEIKGYTCELDRTFLPGNREEYELEIEGMENDDACNYVMDTLSALGYSFSIHQKSKYQRLQEALDGLSS